MEKIPANTHIPDQLIEAYVRGGLPVQTAATISDHLFECDQCNEDYEQTITFINAFREAAPRLIAAEESKVPWWRIPTVPRPIWAAALAMVLLLAIIPRLRQPGAPVVAELTAMRSGDSLTFPAGRAMTLRLDATGSERSGTVRTEVVTQTGQTIEEGQSELADGRWNIVLQKKLPAGHYWIRVFDPATGSQIREYSLILQ